ncbi:putative 2-phosphosulfolactate phosphatase [Rhodococcoides trifolii]|uniref:Probable 2-phosphosulfolactate phosphatase n=1 Tax=Rhodococcoides trifolii TaxID=908250 RepID=A0A917FUM7_9NOCA|nr:2-phosphosulfolactate phosphatase [Rhodococcus trifolii]GGG06863.1 putative 2-phosphosulfolactate phosphatase [Rhodococcus trifolii]
MNCEHRQLDYAVRFDWGGTGAEAIAADTAVVVDVLSFTTTLSVAVDAGIEVLPYRWHKSAADFARRNDAVLAVPRSTAGPDDISLSPATIRSAPTPARLVLPSPNGSTIAQGLQSRPVIGACLRNASAVANHIARQFDTVSIVAAGERWPDGSLRPCVEDLWGAGAVILELIEAGSIASPEAHVAADAWAAVRDNVSTAVRDCASGRELIAMGFPQDVDIATEVNASVSVPVLRAGVFVAG